MAKPRVFISSTFYDLKQIRADIDRFIKEVGYEAVRNEQGNIPYGKDEKLEEYCYKEINSIDILVSIIGGRFGTTSSHGNYSISQVEINTAIKLDKQVFIFIDKNVYAEFRTYQSNKNVPNVKYHYVDNIKIYEFIEYLEGLPKNNPIQTFESSEDITYFLKEQWAGLFQRFLQEQKRVKEINLFQGLENTANTLNQLINYLTEEKKGAEDTIRDILISNHPAFGKLKKLLRVPYRVFFLTKAELNAWLRSLSFELIEEHRWDNPNVMEWLHFSEEETILRINSILFDETGSLKPIKNEDWHNDYIWILTHPVYPYSVETEHLDDLPF